MRSLYLRIYLTVVAALALFALVSGWLVQRHFDEERMRHEGALQERLAAWGELLQRSLPGADAPAAEQASALRDWSQRLGIALALDDAVGQRIASSESFLRRGGDRAALDGPAGLRPGLPGSGAGPRPNEPPPAPVRIQAIRLDDGRTLWTMRPALRGGPPAARGPGGPPTLPPWSVRALPDGGLGLAALLLVLFAAVAAGAYPFVRRLTRRLESLKQGVEAFGAGALHQRVAQDGHDEVAALGASFNQAAGRIEALLRSHQSLLANASHELRSPLARLKMAVTMLEETPVVERPALQREIGANIAELDALVEEVLLASRLDGTPVPERQEAVELLPLAAEEAARVQAELGTEAPAADALVVLGDERLLRRALRNLLENARRYGGGEVLLTVGRSGSAVEFRVCDRGPGVPEAYRERIFEAFFRLPGHAERAGGVGLGLALVRQIAQRHGGSVRCEPRPGGGSCFTLSLPAA